MAKKYVYLAGPISAGGYQDAVEWRRRMDDRLSQHWIKGVSPMRNKGWSSRVARFDETSADAMTGLAGGMHATTNDPKAIFHRDFGDIRRCDGVLAYLPKGVFSWGTAAELGFAFANHKPVVLVTDCPKVAANPIIAGCASVIVPSLEDGLNALLTIFGPYV